MKWCNAALSFLLVTAGIFFVAGWCLLPEPKLSALETSRWDRLARLSDMDWRANTWGFVLGPVCGSLSAWLTIRNANRKSAL